MYDKYLLKYNKTQSYIQDISEQDLYNIIVIPCLNEPDILETLQSIKSCDLPKKSVEVIVVINSSEFAEQDVVEQNNKTFEEVNFFAKKENTTQ